MPDDEPPSTEPPGLTLRDLGERGFVARLRGRADPAPPGVLLGIGDDAAAVRWAGSILLLTTDTLIEDVHFRRATASLVEIGAKALAVNLSDIAAMGGDPRFALLALAAPATLPVAQADQLVSGILEMAGAHRVGLIGGDTCASPDRIVVTITVAGSVDGEPLTRRGARPGDLVLVTGSLGASAAGLAALERGPLPLADHVVGSVLAAHRCPAPRVAEGRLIRASGAATAMIDLSDGLAVDLGHIAAESGVGAEVALAALPVGPPTRAVAEALGEDAGQFAARGGEDYELLFTVRPDAAADLARQVTAETGTPVTVVGRVTPAGRGVRFLDGAGAPVRLRAGFEHFA